MRYTYIQDKKLDLDHLKREKNYVYNFKKLL